MIVLFTDFGANDIYVGQLHAVLATRAPGVPVIDLLHDVPSFDIQSGACLLGGLQRHFPVGSVFMAVVDPGVGGDREPLMIAADNKWFVGPDNGLLSRVIQQAGTCAPNRIIWRPDYMSDSFHGRDLFAPVAAMLAMGTIPAHESFEPQLCATLDIDLIVYIDHYGNAITGRSGDSLATDEKLLVAGREISYARVFCEQPQGEPFWYVNSIGLVEIAANRASATEALGLSVGDGFEVFDPVNGSR